jgi:putative restriction endonuclease
MKGYVGVTDNDWFDFLSKQPEIDEVNFWQPGGRTQFKSLIPGEPFFFKLHAHIHLIPRRDGVRGVIPDKMSY